jgi:hypothetical protein
MGNLTEKELGAIGDLLSAEELLIKKFDMLAQSAQDSALKTKLSGIAEKHQQHFDKLFNHLG